MFPPAFSIICDQCYSLDSVYLIFFIWWSLFRPRDQQRKKWEKRKFKKNFWMGSQTRWFISLMKWVHLKWTFLHPPNENCSFLLFDLVSIESSMKILQDWVINRKTLTFLNQKGYWLSRAGCLSKCFYCLFVPYMIMYCTTYCLILFNIV